jgi:serine/threonine protein kinase
VQHQAVPDREIALMDAPWPAHPTDTTLHSYALGKLDETASTAVERHLQRCEACRQRVSELSGDSFVARVRDAGAGPPMPAPPAAPDAKPSSRSKFPPPDPKLAGKLPPELAANEQYEILRELGRGGMAVVYLARNRLMERLEVLKILNKEMLERKGARQRFLREIQAAARLHHPNIIVAYSALQLGALLVFAMQYVEGHDLAKLVKTRGKLPVWLACSFIRQAALGLQHAHEQGLVHRDIKPGNLMYTQQGKEWVVKILDFGLAKATSEQPMDGSLTHEGQMLGTLDYIAPEQSFDAQKADIRADIYSLGCTFYHLLTGRPPFDGPGAGAILQAHASIEPRPLNLERGDVPVELAAVVSRMMAKDPRRRYQSPAEVAEVLRPFCSQKTAASGRSTAELTPPRPAAPEPVASPPAAVPPAAPEVVPPDDPALLWKSLVTIPEPEGLTDPKPRSGVSGPGRPWPQWMKPALAAGALLILVVAIAYLVGGRRAVPPHVPHEVPPPDEFVSLFNSKDKKGWKTHRSQPGAWRVEHGILIGSGPSADEKYNHLYTERGDFRDFHLRVEARLDDDGNSGVYFRSTYGPIWPTSTPWFPEAYEARIKIERGRSDETGSLFETNSGFLAGTHQSQISRARFFTLEVIARGNHIVIKIDGQTTADYTDPQRLHSSGHIALQQLGSASVGFRTIEIKELPDPNKTTAIDHQLDRHESRVDPRRRVLDGVARF